MGGTAGDLASVAEFSKHGHHFHSESATRSRELGRAAALALVASLHARPCSFSLFLAPSKLLGSGLHVTSRADLATLTKSTKHQGDWSTKLFDSTSDFWSFL